MTMRIDVVHLLRRGGVTIALALLASVISPNATAAATTYYVATSGNDANPGSSASPFRTIQKAADIVNPGDTVIVDDGVYSDNDGNDIVAYLKRGGTASAPVTFKSKNKWGAKLDGLNNRTKHGWHIDAPYIIIQDFEIYGMGGTVGHEGADGIDIESPNTKVIGNNIHDIGRYCTDEPYGLDGIFIGATDTVTIAQNRVHDIGRYSPGEGGCNPSTPYYQNVDHGIYVDGPSNVTIVNNLLYNNKHGWSVHVYPAAVSNLNISNNTFAFPNPYRPGHIVLASNISGAVIANNIFYQPTTAGIRYASGSMVNVVIKKNMTYGGTVLFNDTTPSSGISLSGNADNSDPMLANASAFDFHIRSLSPAIDAGGPTTDVLTDFDGNLRPQGLSYDIGAYEFTGSTPALVPPSAPTNVRVVR
jgi:hypothetical protein